MSTTVKYKGSTIATLNNQTKTLTTAGTWVEGNIEIVDTKDTAILQSKTATPTESSQTITANSGYDGLSSVTVGAISSTYVGSGIDRNDSSDLTVNGATVKVPRGYYESQASKMVASGIAGTPTATKGTVTNHAISVTPSVTNTTGYITGSTKTGTAVTVSASELVSGTKTITENGTGIDVTNYASVNVNVAGGGANSAISLVDTIVVPSNTRAIDIDLSTYLNNYDILIIAQDVTLTASDWLYYSPNVHNATGGKYNSSSKINHTGICFWFFLLGGSNQHIYGYTSSSVFNQAVFSSNPISNLYIYTYASTKMITANSNFKIYGGNYANL